MLISFQMTRIDFPKWLREELSRQQMIPAELSRRSGITEGTISRILSGARRPKIETVKEIARALMLDENYVLGAAGFISPAPEINPQHAELTHLFDMLPKKEQREIIAIIRLKLESE